MPELSNVLNVWWDNRLVGRFERTANGVTFAYDRDVATRSISLSLTLEGGWSQHAPGNSLLLG